jgi:hypothetical protein
MANPDRFTAITFAAALANILTACSAVAGQPTAPPPYAGPIAVELAFTDSFDVLPDGKCRGRGIFRAAADQGSVDIRRTATRQSDDPGVIVPVSVRYARDGLRRGIYDDGQYCVARFVFVPSRPNLYGYRAALSSPEDPYGNWPLDIELGPPHDGRIRVVIQSCTDYDAPPERECGYG